MLNSTEQNLLSTSLTFWENLSRSQKDYLINNTQINHFSKDTIIHYGENECIGVLLVQNGSLRTYITSDEGREITLFRIEANNVCILSASCILQSIDFDVCISAEKDCDILTINSATYKKLVDENVYVSLFTYKLATERFSDVMWAMQQILFTSFDRRLAAFLIEEAARSQSNIINMTHEQIAKYLGSAREVVSRMLKYFSKEGYVSLTRGEIHITNLNGLKHI